MLVGATASPHVTLEAGDRAGMPGTGDEDDRDDHDGGRDDGREHEVDEGECQGEQRCDRSTCDEEEAPASRDRATPTSSARAAGLMSA
jgi:hypothetical protein